MVSFPLLKYLKHNEKSLIWFFKIIIALVLIITVILLSYQTDFFFMMKMSVYINLFFLCLWFTIFLVYGVKDEKNDLLKIIGVWITVISTLAVMVWTTYTYYVNLFFDFQKEKITYFSESNKSLEASIEFKKYNKTLIDYLDSVIVKVNSNNIKQTNNSTADIQKDKIYIWYYNLPINAAAIIGLFLMLWIITVWEREALKPIKNNKHLRYYNKKVNSKL